MESSGVAPEAPKIEHLRSWADNLFPNLRDAAIRWSEDDASSMAASVAYYLALSLFPMVLVLTSGLGMFLRFSKLGQDAHQKLLETVAFHGSPVIEAQVAQVLKQFEQQSVVSGPFGMLAAVLTAIGVFAQIDRGFDRVWRIRRKKSDGWKSTILGVLRHRLFAFLMLLFLGGMVVTLFVSGMLLAHFRSLADDTLPSLAHVFSLAELMFIVSANALLFGMVYKWLPKKEVRWMDALRGGMIAAIVWEVGREILGMFLIGMRYTSAYGVIGSFIALLLWCYYGMSIFFFGAEYVQVLEAKRHTSGSASSDESTRHSFSEPARIGIEGNETSVVGQPAENAATASIEPPFESASTTNKVRPRLRR